MRIHALLALGLLSGCDIIPDPSKEEGPEIMGTWNVSKMVVTSTTPSNCNQGIGVVKPENVATLIDQGTLLFEERVPPNGIGKHTLTRRLVGVPEAVGGWDPGVIGDGEGITIYDANPNWNGSWLSDSNGAQIHLAHATCEDFGGGSAAFSKVELLLNR